MGNKQGKEKKGIINETIIGMVQSERIQKNGEAISQMLQAYKGERYDSSGKNLGHKGRSLRDISRYKINKGCMFQNIKQQSGFSAELIKEARDNKKAIRSGNLRRTRTTDGIGLVNHQKYDHIILDLDGNLVKGSGSQMKFLGVDGKGRVPVIDKIAGDSEWKKYDSYIDIPKEQYEKAVQYADDKANKLKNRANSFRNKGDLEKAREMEKRAKKYEEAKKKIRKSNVKESEAINARINPKKFVTKELLVDSHKAGLEATKGAFILSGSISCAQNLYSVVYENKSVDEAIADVIKVTLKSGGTAYGIGTVGTSIKAIMHTSRSDITRKLGTTSAPAMIATGTVEVSKSIKRYAKGEIDEVELLEELGEKGTGMIAAGFGTAAGTAVGAFILPGIGPVVGGFVGGMVAYTMSGILYKETLEVLKDAKMSEERRKIIEELSKKSIKEMQAYQQALIKYANLEFQRREDLFVTFFEGIYRSILSNNIDSFIRNINGIGQEFGISLEFQTFQEFEQAMGDDDVILTL